MRLESQGQGIPARLPGIFDNPVQNRLVPAMHTIEVSECQDRTVEAASDPFEMTQHLHPANMGCAKLSRKRSSRPGPVVSAGRVRPLRNADVH